MSEALPVRDGQLLEAQHARQIEKGKHVLHIVFAEDRAGPRDAGHLRQYGAGLVDAAKAVAADADDDQPLEPLALGEHHEAGWVRSLALLGRQSGDEIQPHVAIGLRDHGGTRPVDLTRGDLRIVVAGMAVVFLCPGWRNHRKHQEQCRPHHGTPRRFSRRHPSSPVRLMCRGFSAPHAAGYTGRDFIPIQPGGHVFE